MAEPNYSWLQWIKIKLGLRDNEYDTATPGPERPMTGLLSSLPPEKRRAVLDYRGPEVLGGSSPTRLEHVNPTRFP